MYPLHTYTGAQTDSYSWGEELIQLEYRLVVKLTLCACSLNIGTYLIQTLAIIEGIWVWDTDTRTHTYTPRSMWSKHKSLESLITASENTQTHTRRNGNAMAARQEHLRHEIYKSLKYYINISSVSIWNFKTKRKKKTIYIFLAEEPIFANFPVFYLLNWIWCVDSISHTASSHIAYNV